MNDNGKEASEEYGDKYLDRYTNMLNIRTSVK